MRCWLGELPELFGFELGFVECMQTSRVNLSILSCTCHDMFLTRSPDQMTGVPSLPCASLAGADRNVSQTCPCMID